MKSFALQLEGCSKESRKKCQKLHDSISGKLDDGDRFKDNDWSYLVFGSNYRYYCENTIVRPIYQMPRDWNKIQEALGVEVEPRDGEVWFTSGVYDWVFRSNGNASTGYYSNICVGGGSFEFNINATSKGTTCVDYGVLRKATPEEEAKLIKAEHENGWHWNGKELVKISEYVECVGCSGTGFTVNKIYNWPNPIDDDGHKRTIRIMSGSLFQFKLSTREAYEAQQAEEREPKLIGMPDTEELLKYAARGLEIKMLEYQISKLKSENERLRAKLNQISEVCDCIEF